MPALTVNIPAAAINRVQDAFVASYGYQDEVPNGSGGVMPNPETKIQFVQKKIRNYIQEVVQGYEASAAAAAASAAVQPVNVTVT